MASRNDETTFGENVHIYGNVKIGHNVTIGDSCIIYDNVIIGNDTFIGPFCILGEPLKDYYINKNYSNPPLYIGNNSIIRSGCILYAGSEFGDYLETGHRVTIREHSKIGIHCRIGTLSDIQGYVIIGDYCRFHSNVHICQKAIIKNYVWIFPYVILTNDPHPPSDTCIQGPEIEEFAVICSGAVIMPGVRVGANSLIGAKSLVTKNVPDNVFVLGMPAKIIGPITDIKCKNGRLSQPYPWRLHYDKGYPWQKQE